MFNHPASNKRVEPECRRQNQGRDYTANCPEPSSTSYRIFGENDFAARFPSAVAAALTAVVILSWGTHIGGSRVGWSAAIIFTLSLQTFVHAKAAVADMWLVLFMTMAHWAGYEMLPQ